MFAVYFYACCSLHVLQIELVNMIIECCSQERSYSTFYGLVGERFSKLNRVWTECFETAFENYFTTIHRYETNRLRNIARFFGHLLGTDSISWMVFSCVNVNEDDTTSSSRIFIKIMMQEMMESMGLKTLVERFKDPEVRTGCRGMFPMDIPKNTRFSINYFTSIGLGAVTEEMREYLKVCFIQLLMQGRALTACCRMRPRLSWSNGDRCWKRNRHRRTLIRQTRIPQVIQIPLTLTLSIRENVPAVVHVHQSTAAVDR